MVGDQSNPRKEEEIDIVCINNNSGLFAECKWRNQKTGIKEYNELVRKSGLVRTENKYYYLFSKSGFTKELETISREINNLSLVKLSDMEK